MDIESLDDIAKDIPRATITPANMRRILSGPEPGLVKACQHYARSPSGNGQPLAEYNNLEGVINWLSLTTSWKTGLGPEWADLDLSPAFYAAFEACIHCAGIARLVARIASGRCDDLKALLTSLGQAICAALRVAPANDFDKLVSELGASWPNLAHQSPSSFTRGSSGDFVDRSRMLDHAFSVFDDSIKSGALKPASSGGRLVHNTAFLKDLTRWIAGLDICRDDKPRLVAFAVAYADGLEDKIGEAPRSASGNDTPGDVYHFVFERFPGGLGSVYLNPRQMFLGLANDFLNGVLETAALAAKACLGGDSPTDSIRVSIREVTQRNGVSQIENRLLLDRVLRGVSASGAAALGIFHSWRGTFPDSDLVVLARVDEIGTVKPVDLLEKKAEAIACSCPGWTAVVPDKKSADILEKNNKGRFHVVVC